MWELFRRRTRVNIYFLPSLTVAVQVCLLFVAGILNLLKEAAVLLWLIGIIYLCVTLIKDKSIRFLEYYLKTGYVFCAFTMIVMLIFVRGKVFSHYDNFSHWALVVKSMMVTNRYPNFNDTLISFQSYPLGSATYIYYFSKMINRSESMQMLAQIYMMTACIMPIFIFEKKNKFAVLVSVLSFTNLFFVYNVTITNLLVDTLLPIASMCALLFVYKYCGKMDGGGQTIRYLAAAYLVQIIQIKNSGIYFVLIAVIWILYKGKIAKDYSKRIVPALFPFISLILWQKHCRYVFNASETSKHAMTAENYKSVFSSKSIEEIRAISGSLIKFAATYKDTWFVFGAIAVTGLAIVCIYKEYCAFWRKAFAFSILLYLSYHLGILGMYLFSMPGGEATELASHVRYTKTILIAIIYIATIIYVRLISYSASQRYIPIAMAIFAIAFSLGLMQISFGEARSAIQYKDSPEERIWLEQAKSEHGVPEGESCCILIKKNDSGYAYFLGKYIFQTNAVKSVRVKGESDMDAINSKYIFVYDSENPTVQEWIQNHYPDQAGSKVIIREAE